MDKIIPQNDRENRIYNQGVETGRDHSVMSPDTAKQIGEIKIHMDYVKKKVDDIDDKLDTDYVTYKEFQPIKTLVFGFTGLILVAVVGGIMALIIK